MRPVVVSKLETWLRIAGIPYEVVDTPDPRKGPKGKVPFIEDGGVRIGDSSLIVGLAGHGHASCGCLLAIAGCQGQPLAEVFKATAARMRALKAFSSISSPS